MRVTPELNAEHAPPAWAGGSELALTCKSCNNGAGTLFDAEAQKQHDLRSIFAGQADQPIRAALSIDGVTLNGDWHMAGNAGMTIFGVPKGE